MCIQVFKKWYYNVCIQNRRNVVFSKHLRKWNQKSVCLLSFILSPHLQSKKINSKQSLNCYPSLWISYHMCRSYSNIKKSKRKYYLITIWKKRHFFQTDFRLFFWKQLRFTAHFEIRMLSITVYQYEREIDLYILNSFMYTIIKKLFVLKLFNFWFTCNNMDTKIKFAV